jgi:hypothetical protein
MVDSSKVRNFPLTSAIIALTSAEVNQGPEFARIGLIPGSLTRFYKLFSLAFSAYSVLWIAGWMTHRGHAPA